MTTIHQMEEKGNEMANAHLPKPGLCSPAAMEVNCPSTAFKGPPDFDVLRQRQFAGPPFRGHTGDEKTK